MKKYILLLGVSLITLFALYSNIKDVDAKTVCSGDMSKVCIKGDGYTVYGEKQTETEDQSPSDDGR